MELFFLLLFSYELPRSTFPRGKLVDRVGRDLELGITREDPLSAVGKDRGDSRTGGLTSCRHAGHGVGQGFAGLK